MGEWIKCSDQLPKENGIYIVAHRYPDVPNLPCVQTEICDFATDLGDVWGLEDLVGKPGWWDQNTGDDFWDRFEIEGITHWMPLPEPPKGDLK